MAFPFFRLITTSHPPPPPPPPPTTIIHLYGYRILYTDNTEFIDVGLPPPHLTIGSIRLNEDGTETAPVKEIWGWYEHGPLKERSEVFMSTLRSWFESNHNNGDCEQIKDSYGFGPSTRSLVTMSYSRLFCVACPGIILVLIFIIFRPFMYTSTEPFSSSKPDFQPRTALPALIYLPKPTCPMTTLRLLPNHFPHLRAIHNDINSTLLTLPTDVGQEAVHAMEACRNALVVVEAWGWGLEAKRDMALKKLKNLYEVANAHLLDGRSPKEVELVVLKEVGITVNTLSSLYDAETSHDTQQSQSQASTPISTLTDTHVTLRLALAAVPARLRNHTLTMHTPPGTKLKYLAQDMYESLPNIGYGNAWLNKVYTRPNDDQTGKEAASNITDSTQHAQVPHKEQIPPAEQDNVERRKSRRQQGGRGGTLVDKIFRVLVRGGDWLLNSDASHLSTTTDNITAFPSSAPITTTSSSPTTASSSPTQTSAACPNPPSFHLAQLHKTSNLASTLAEGSSGVITPLVQAEQEVLQFALRLRNCIQAAETSGGGGKEEGEGCDEFWPSSDGREHEGGRDGVEINEEKEEVERRKRILAVIVQGYSVW